MKNIIIAAAMLLFVMVLVPQVSFARESCAEFAKPQTDLWKPAGNRTGKNCFYLKRHSKRSMLYLVGWGNGEAGVRKASMRRRYRRLAQAALGRRFLNVKQAVLQKRQALYNNCLADLKQASDKKVVCQKKVSKITLKAIVVVSGVADENKFSKTSKARGVKLNYTLAFARQSSWIGAMNRAVKELKISRYVEVRPMRGIVYGSFRGAIMRIRLEVKFTGGQSAQILRNRGKINSLELRMTKLEQRMTSSEDGTSNLKAMYKKYCTKKSKTFRVPVLKPNNLDTTGKSVLVECYSLEKEINTLKADVKNLKLKSQERQFYPAITAEFSLRYVFLAQFGEAKRSFDDSHAFYGCAGASMFLYGKSLKVRASYCLELTRAASGEYSQEGGEFNSLAFIGLGIRPVAGFEIDVKGVYAALSWSTRTNTAFEGTALGGVLELSWLPVATFRSPGEQSYSQPFQGGWNLLNLLRVSGMFGLYHLERPSRSASGFGIMAGLRIGTAF